MSLFKRRKDELGEWIKKATDKELADAYEERRQKWLKEEARTTGRKTLEMERLNEEIGRRATEKWGREHPNKDPNYRWSDANRWEKD